jgi:hypothetical protein
MIGWVGDKKELSAAVALRDCVCLDSADGVAIAGDEGEKVGVAFLKSEHSEGILILKKNLSENPYFV